jgi:hypothetical protein
MAYNGNKWKQLNYLISLHENLQGFERWICVKSFNFVKKNCNPLEISTINSTKGKHYDFEVGYSNPSRRSNNTMLAILSNRPKEMVIIDLAHTSICNV